jgi:cytochrome c oxidase subunit 2
MNAHLASASLLSHAVNHQTLFLLTVSSIFVVLVFFLMIFFSIKYRKGSNANRDAPPTQSKPLEMTLIGVILLFGLTTFFFSARTYYQMYTPPANAQEIFVIAKQWLWIFHDPRHPNADPNHLNELTVTLNEPVRLTMISEDVIHSFYVPAFRMKQDVLPDRYTTAWFTPTELGDFEVLCTQYCGLRHSQMRAMIHVVPPLGTLTRAELPATNEVGHKTSAAAAAAPATMIVNAPNAHSGEDAIVVKSAGEKLLQEKGCYSCHEPNANAHEPSIGPSLAGIFGTQVELTDGRVVTVDQNYLRRSLFEPNAEIVKGYAAIMPSFLGLLNEKETTEVLQAIEVKKKEKSE